MPPNKHQFCAPTSLGVSAIYSQDTLCKGWTSTGWSDLGVSHMVSPPRGHLAARVVSFCFSHSQWPLCSVAVVLWLPSTGPVLWFLLPLGALRWNWLQSQKPGLSTGWWLHFWVGGLSLWLRSTRIYQPQAALKGPESEGAALVRHFSLSWVKVIFCRKVVWTCRGMALVVTLLVSSTAAKNLSSWLWLLLPNQRLSH